MTVRDRSRASTTSKPKTNHLWGDDWGQVRDLWDLDPRVSHLNHGSYGAVPLVIQQEQQRWRSIAESNPMDFFSRRARDFLSHARVRISEFLGADRDSVAFVTNATTGVNAVVKSLDLGPRDELLVTDHCYGAVRMTVQRACDETGAHLRIVAIPLEGITNSEIVDLICLAANDRTRLAIFDQISSPTAMVFPVEQIVHELSRKGVPSLIDGAHAPGSLPLNLSSLGATYWVGNFHKWVCAPRGSAALYVAPEARSTIKPLVSSWFEDEGFPQSFDWLGTDDISDYLSVPAALDLMASIGWERIRVHNHQLINAGAQEIVRRSKLRRPERADTLVACMEIFELPRGTGESEEAARAISKRISKHLKAEVAVFPWKDRGWMRLSAHIYNCLDEYSALGSTLEKLV